jgi:hypothetical protein
MAQVRTLVGLDVRVGGTVAVAISMGSLGSCAVSDLPGARRRFRRLWRGSIARCVRHMRRGRRGLRWLAAWRRRASTAWFARRG